MYLLPLKLLCMIGRISTTLKYTGEAEKSTAVEASVQAKH